MPRSTRQKGKIDTAMLMLAMLLIVTSFLLFQFWRLLERSQKHNFDEVELLSLSHGVLHDNSFLIKTIRMYVLSRDEDYRIKYLNKLNDYDCFLGRLDKMKEIGLTESELEKTAQIMGIWDKLEKIEADALRAADDADYEKAISIVFGGEYVRTDSLLVDIFQNLIAEIETRGRATTSAMNRRVHLVMLLFSAAFLAILTSLALTFRNNNRLREQAERSSRYKSAFLANMSHEIRTPMNAILGITEIQLREGNLPQEMEEALGEVYNSGSLLLNIINDILDLSKIEAGKLEIIPVKYDLPSLINDVVQITCLRYDSKSIDFYLDVDENAPLNLFGDVLRLKQILNNILSNAFKYTDAGEVRMSVRSEPGTGSGEAVDGDNVTLVFKISDTGQGMTAEQLKRLFDEYTRFNMEANRLTVGTGLGMSITKRLVDLMGGEIHVESTVGKGSVFTLKSPQKRADSLICGKETVEKLSTFRFRSVGVTNKIRMLREYMPYGSVLVVDDVKSNLYVAKGMLMPYGLKIDTASSGFEAIDKIKAGNEYDIIFMDHMMPKMDGIAAVKIIRGMGYARSIVALTANALVGQAEMFLRNGFDGYISKPIDSRELNLVLNDFIRDKMPPDVVKEARRARQEKDAADADAHNTKILSEKTREAEKFFILDAENAISVFERVCAKPGNIDEAEINIYEVTAHGIKCALKNIGEIELADAALNLELAAKSKNFAVLRKESPTLAESLKFLIKKFNRPEGDADAQEHYKPAGEDAVSLREKLTAIENACEKLDVQAAEAALRELTRCAWPPRISDTLNGINVDLMHSDFKKAASRASECISMIDG